MAKLIYAAIASLNGYFEDEDGAFGVAVSSPCHHALIGSVRPRCIEYDTSMMFAHVLSQARRAAGLTQAEVSARSGVARPNIAAFESGRREPRWKSAVLTLEATGATISIEQPITWSWTNGRRPYAVPTGLWRLPIVDAVRVLTPGFHLWWSGPSPQFDLADRSARCRAYELVLREGTPDDIASVVDGVLLIDAWPDLILPVELRRAWQHLIDGAHPKPAEAS
jgi:transcriptional regulator with XRE-family HTH domain